MHGRGNSGSMKYDNFFFSPLGKRIMKVEAKFITKHIKGVSLSIGCGTGIIEKEIEKTANAKIIGIEIDDGMLSIAKERIDVIKANAMALPFKNSSIDTIFFIASLEFIYDYKKAIDEAYRVLKNDGKLMAILLNTSSSYFKQRYEKGGYIRKNIKHLDISAIFKYMKRYFMLHINGLFEIRGDELLPGKSVYGIVGGKKE